MTKFPLENVHVLDEELLLGEMRYSPADLCWMSACMVPCGGGLDEVGFRQGETVIVVPSTGYFGGAGMQVALAIGGKVVAMGRNEVTLQSMKTFGKERESTVKTSGDVEADKKNLAVAAPGGAEVFLDLSPPMAASNSHFRATMEMLKAWGRMVLMARILSNVELN